jgi:protein-S-isoprenylcysteine O-methyltransferase Ste14
MQAPQFDLTARPAPSWSQVRTMITRNPMYLGLAFVYAGIAIADQSVWALILLPVVLAVIQRYAIETEEAFLERRFGANYISYKETVRRWL